MNPPFPRTPARPQNAAKPAPDRATSETAWTP